MDIQKSFRVAAPQAEVWEFITSAERVATCLPGVKEVKVQAPGKYKGVMAIKVGPIKTSVNADVVEREQRPPEYAVYEIKGEEGGRASRMNAEATLSLTGAAEDQTDVAFTANVVIVGRLGKFAGGVMDKFADSMSEQFIVDFRRQLEPESDITAVGEKLGLWARFKAWLRRALFGY